MSKSNSILWICDLGETSYAKAFELQKKLRDLRIAKKIPDIFLLTCHPPVFTLGKRPCEEDFLSSQEEISKEGIEIFQSNRGGKITYHGPGQIVGYFIFDLRSHHLTIPAFVHRIEEILIQTLQAVGLEACRDPEYPGVWIKNKKIAALGLHFDRGVSMHGFSLNMNPNLEHYRHIVPCGIQGREVTSLYMEAGIKNLEDLRSSIEQNAEKIFARSVEKKASEFLWSFFRSSCQ